MRFPFRTLSQAFQISGVGLHSGCAVNVTLKPSSQLGITFTRSDLNNLRILASYQHIKSTFHATVIGNDNATISTPEHLLAALWGMGITHCEIEINGSEVPILDGSAAIWCDLLKTAGSVLVGGERPIWKIQKPLRVEDHGAMMLALPYSGLRLTVAADFDVPYLPQQLVDFEMKEIDFCREIAPARTFTLEKWVEPLRTQGLIRGGSIDNALVLGEDKASSSLRFPEELARHKALDALGDLALLTSPHGALWQAHFILIRAGHGLHSQWMRAAENSNLRIYDRN
ncbi:MAG: UDP-3-O-acyl-N-acetylglucosamine deacetylase [Abditibacteriaceae bacterium]